MSEAVPPAPEASLSAPGQQPPAEGTASMIHTSSPQADAVGAPAVGSTAPAEQSSVPRPDDVKIQQPSLEELRNRVKATLAQRKPPANAPREASPSSSSGSDSDSDSDSGSSSSSSSAAPGDYKSLAQRRAELAKLLAEAQDQGDSDSESDAEEEEIVALPGGDSDDEDDEGRRGTGKTGGAVHALFQGPATKNEMHDIPADGPNPVALPEGLSPGDRIEGKERLRYLGVIQSVIDDAVVVVRQDVASGGGALPPPRPGSSYLPYGGKLCAPGPHAEVYAVIDTGSILTLEDGTVVGAVFETFGSLHEPFYSILLPQEKPAPKPHSQAPATSEANGKTQGTTSAPEFGEAQSTSIEPLQEPAKDGVESVTAGEQPLQANAAEEDAKPVVDPTIAPVSAGQVDVPVPEAAASSVDAPPAFEAKPFRAIDLPMGTKIYFDTVTCSIVETAALKQLPKGSDASNLHDEEVGEEEQEYSDDEAEQQARRARKAQKRPASSLPREDKRSRSEREYTLPGASYPYEGPSHPRGEAGRGRGRGRGRGGRASAPSYHPTPVPVDQMPVHPHGYSNPGYAGWAGPAYAVPSQAGQAPPAAFAPWPYYAAPPQVEWGRAPPPPLNGDPGYDPAAPGYQPGPTSRPPGGY